MDILEKLFGSAAKVKIIKLFLFNPDSAFDNPEAAERAKVSKAVTRREISNLEKIGFIKPRFYSKTIKRQKNRTMETFHKRVNGWTLDNKFPYIEAIKSFLSNINPFKHREIIDRISRAGKIQLLIISGVFIKDPDSRADLLVVGDNLKQGQLDNIIKTIESEIGKEIRYAVFETSEFKYRYSMFDKLIRDILDYPHEKIINKLNL
jgi:predicted transcriptional regulator